ncbi:MAG: hypothetical protein J0H43_06025, partial [Actinobacteria bacterium]|nr:hypothetical protein [Actinomycetota bacterium]
MIRILAGSSSPVAPTPTGRTGRCARAAVFAALSLTLAASAHVLGGGPMPPAWLLAGAAGVLLLFAGLVTGRERGGGFIAAAVISTQLLLHAAFALLPTVVVLLGPHPGLSPGAQTSLWAKLLFCHHGTHPITAAQVDAAKATLGIASTQLAPTGGSAPVSGAVGGAASVLAAAVTSWPVLLMLAAHLVAASVMAWWLRRGERAAGAMSREVVRAVRARVVGWSVVTPDARRPAT